MESDKAVITFSLRPSERLIFAGAIISCTGSKVALKGEVSSDVA
jgi:flagellar biosynthesis regulator FlbT